MNVVEKREFIHSHLHQANEKTINVIKLKNDLII
jgi:hypothetical protein